MKILLLICLLLSSCSPIQKRLERNRISKLPKTSEVIQNVDLSGTLYQLGGMLINNHQLIHVTHWPIKIGQPVRLLGIDGVNTHRTILSKEDLGDDLSILTLNEPVDLTNHTIITIAKPIIGIPTTVFRFEGRPSIGTVVAGYNSKGRVNLNLAYNMQLLSGDSGKISVQRQNGEIVVVTLNSTASGTGPDLHKLLK